MEVSIKEKKPTEHFTPEVLIISNDKKKIYYDIMLYHPNFDNADQKIINFFEFKLIYDNGYLNKFELFNNNIEIMKRRVIDKKFVFKISFLLANEFYLNFNGNHFSFLISYSEKNIYRSKNFKLLSDTDYNNFLLWHIFKHDSEKNLPNENSKTSMINTHQPNNIAENKPIEFPVINNEISKKRPINTIINYCDDVNKRQKTDETFNNKIIDNQRNNFINDNKKNDGLNNKKIIDNQHNNFINNNKVIDNQVYNFINNNKKTDGFNNNNKIIDNQRNNFINNNQKTNDLNNNKIIDLNIINKILDDQRNNINIQKKVEEANNFNNNQKKFDEANNFNNNQKKFDEVNNFNNNQKKIDEANNFINNQKKFDEMNNNKIIDDHRNKKMKQNEEIINLTTSLLEKINYLIKKTEENQIQVPKEIQIQVPKENQIEVPKENRIEVPKEIQIEVPKENQIEVPKENQIEVPKENQIQVPKENQIEVPKENQIQVPKENQIEVPKENQVPENQSDKIDVSIKEFKNKKDNFTRNPKILITTKNKIPVVYAILIKNITNTRLKIDLFNNYDDHMIKGGANIIEVEKINNDILLKVVFNKQYLISMTRRIKYFFKISVGKKILHTTDKFILSSYNNARSIQKRQSKAVDEKLKLDYILN